jgi:hypothetical protein
MVDQPNQPGTAMQAPSPEPASPAPAPAPRPATIADAYETGDVQASDYDVPMTTNAGPSSAVPASTGRSEGEGTSEPPHSAYTLKLARELGIEEGDIAVCSKEQLERLVYYQTKQARDGARAAARDDAVAAARQRDPATGRFVATEQAPVPQANTQTPASASVPEEDADIARMESEGYDAQMIGMFKRLTKQNKELRGQVEQLYGAERFRQQESLADQIDRLFSDLGENYHPVFGKGRGRDMNGESPEWLKRISVVTAMDRLTGTIPERFKKAVTALYGTAAPEPIRSGPLSTERWNGGALARPTQRSQPEEAQGEKKALRTAAAYMKEHGMGDNDDMTTEGFLD